MHDLKLKPLTVKFIMQADGAVHPSAGVAPTVPLGIVVQRTVENAYRELSGLIDRHDDQVAGLALTLL